VIRHPLFDAVLSPLDRVVAVGKTAEVAGVRVELTAVEIRGSGAILFWRARPVGDLMLLYADIRATDDRGTAYESHPAGHEGSSLHWAGQSVLVPPPPIGARLVVEILSFGPPVDHEVARGVSGQHIHGPWRFDVDV
jgi:hypothetical protein